MFGKKDTPAPEASGTGYAYCESVHAGPLSPHHIRKLTDVGMKLGGGVDTPTLCGKDIDVTNGWDVFAVKSDDDVMALSEPRPGNDTRDASWRACRRCAVAYLEQTSSLNK